jgi:hypothetical protein
MSCAPTRENIASCSNIRRPEWPVQQLRLYSYAAERPRGPQSALRRTRMGLFLISLRKACADPCYRDCLFVSFDKEWVGTMTLVEAFVAEFRRLQVSLRKQIASMEEGLMRTEEKRGGQWVTTTSQTLAHAEQTLAAIERLLLQAEKRTGKPGRKI